MKKILTTIAFLISLSASAQWQIEKNEADELKGTAAYTNYFYDAPEGGFNYIDEYSMISIGTKNGIFNTEYSSGYHGAVVIIGLYNSEDKLLEKITMWLDSYSGEHNILRTRNAGTMSNPVGQKKKVKKIFEHLMQTTGYIRILAPLYGKPNLDLKIPHIQQE